MAKWNSIMLYYMINLKQLQDDKKFAFPLVFVQFYKCFATGLITVLGKIKLFKS